MLPSLLAREVQNGLKHFLRTGFEPSDPLFAGVMQIYRQPPEEVNVVGMHEPFVALRDKMLNSFTNVKNGV